MNPSKSDSHNYDGYEITIEETRTYIVTREDVPKWTDEEWAEAVEAAIGNDTLHDAWDALPRDCITDGSIDDVRTRVLPEARTA